MRYAAPLAVLTTAVLAGCQQGGASIRPDAIDAPMRRVAARHNAYVERDATLSPLEKRIFERDANILTSVLDAAKSQPLTTQPAR